MYTVLENIIIVVRPIIYILVLLSPVLFKKQLFKNEKNLGFVEEDYHDDVEEEELEELEDDVDEELEDDMDEELEDDVEEDEVDDKAQKTSTKEDETIIFNKSSIENNPQNNKDININDFLIQNIHFPIEGDKLENDVDTPNLNKYEQKKTKVNVNWCCSLSTKEN